MCLFSAQLIVYKQIVDYTTNSHRLEQMMEFVPKVYSQLRRDS